MAHASGACPMPVALANRSKLGDPVGTHSRLRYQNVTQRIPGGMPHLSDTPAKANR
jgi:hypothetical protein